MVGKASKRKSQRRSGIGPSRADVEKRRAYRRMLTGMQAMIDSFEYKKEREQQARMAWAGGAEPPRAVMPHWSEDSVGDRFFATETIENAASAPRLADAVLPGPEQIAENSGHWAVAVSALVRAVVLDGIPVSDATVGRVLDLLTPVVRDELSAATREDGDFPDSHGPLFLLGGCVLTDATWAIVGLDPLDRSLSVMERRIDQALDETEHSALPGGKSIAEELVRAFAGEYQCDEARDAQTLQRLGWSTSGNPLVDLVQAKEVAPEDALRLGLIVLAALAELARTDAESPAEE